MGLCRAWNKHPLTSLAASAAKGLRCFLLDLSLSTYSELVCGWFPAVELYQLLKY